jgi:hypothetical protein
MSTETKTETGYVYDDGGREAAGFTGTTGDCSTRAIAIATRQPYEVVYDALNELARGERPRGDPRTGRRRPRSSARTGVSRATIRCYIRPRPDVHADHGHRVRLHCPSARTNCPPVGWWCRGPST